MYIDHSLYPEQDAPPDELGSAQERGDYLHRVCCAWDFGVHPEPQTFDLFRGWMDIFDCFPCATSVGYHAFRAWFGWRTLPFQFAPPLPRWVHLDRLEGRGADPCEKMI